MTSDKGIYVYLENHLLITYLKKERGEVYTFWFSTFLGLEKTGIGNLSFKSGLSPRKKCHIVHHHTIIIIN